MLARRFERQDHRQMICNSKLIGSQTGYPGDMNPFGVVAGPLARLVISLVLF